MKRQLDDKILRRIHHAEHEGMYLHELAKIYHVACNRLRTELAAWRIRNGKRAAVTAFTLEKAAERAAPRSRRKWGSDKDWLFAK